MSKHDSLEAVIVAYQELATQNPDKAVIHLNLANVLMGQGNLGEATKEYQEAIRLKIKKQEAYWYLGDALIHQGKREEALAVWREAIRRKPNDKIALSKIRQTLTQLAS
jgi:cytochrome c-type biogenesis protein CcmH/NrfG